MTKEEKKAYAKEYRKLNKQKIADYQRAWYDKNRAEVSVKQRQYYNKHKERHLQGALKYRENNVHSVMATVCKLRAAKMKVPYDLTGEYIASIWPRNNKCPILKTPFIRAARGTNRNDSASIDRIHPDKGYVRGNVVIISMLANRIKNNATPEQIAAVARYFKKLVLR